jgi:CrcB protein
MRLALNRGARAADGLYSKSFHVVEVPGMEVFLSLPTHSMQSLDRRELAAIFAGGFIGAIARALMVDALPHDAGEWPWATFVVNVAGAFALGYFTTRLQERLPLSSYRRPFLGTGFCGALTTFSTMQVELLVMLDGGHVALAAAYASVSVIAGFAAVALATNVVRRARIA